jgi:AcrR family transcriptional regulator
MLCQMAEHASMARMVADSDAEVISLRERKKASTRARLIEVAVELFVTKGFEATTVEEVAAACEVSPRTFFRYFATKEDLLFADPDERSAQILDVIARRPRREAPIETLRAAMLELSDIYEANRPTLVMRRRVFQSTEALRGRQFERQTRGVHSLAVAIRGREPGLSELEARVIAGAATAAMRAAIETWLDSDGPSLREVVSESFDVLVAGLAPRSRRRSTR